LGTTDTLRKKSKLEPRALEKEIDFILETASNYLNPAPKRADVRSIFAGLRPLARPKEGSTKTKEISRSHKIILSKSGLVTLTGGKWTTFRKMGEDTVNFFGRVNSKTLPASQSAQVHIHGFTDTIASGHWGIYGSDAEKIQALALQYPRLAESIHPKFPHILAEVVWACQHEMALTVEDVLSRRIRMLVLDAQAAIDAAPGVAQIMAEALGKEESWINAELLTFQKIAQQYLIEKK
jgi:glycerol-3-phosphate dehydrogenase